MSASGSELAFAAVNAAFGSLGRVCMALDGDFRVRHVSAQLDTLLSRMNRGEGTLGRMASDTMMYHDLHALSVSLTALLTFNPPVPRQAFRPTARALPSAQAAREKRP